MGEKRVIDYATVLLVLCYLITEHSSLYLPLSFSKLNHLVLVIPRHY